MQQGQISTPLTSGLQKQCSLLRSHLISVNNTTTDTTEAVSTTEWITRIIPRHRCYPGICSVLLKIYYNDTKICEVFEAYHCSDYIILQLAKMWAHRGSYYLICGFIIPLSFEISNVSAMKKQVVCMDPLTECSGRQGNKTPNTLIPQYLKKVT